MGNILIPSSKNWNWDQGRAENCNIYANYRRNRNGTGSFFGTGGNGFEGIPQNFVLNLIACLLMNGLFVILRKKAWNYGRMAVMQKNEMKWTDMFYGDDDDGDEVQSLESVQDNIQGAQGTPTPPPPASKTAELGLSNVAAIEAAMIARSSVAPSATERASILAYSHAKINEILDNGYFSWIKIVFTLTDQQFREKCGPDCVFYLSFQRHLIVLAAIITLCSLVIILPINLRRRMEEEDPNTFVEFSDTSIISLENRHNWLWAHITLAISFLFISIVIMRHFSRELQITKEDYSDMSHAVMIIGINRKKCDEGLLRDHLQEIYPNSEVTEVCFAYDISKLQALEFQRLSAASARLYWQDYMEHKNCPRPRMRPYYCSSLLCRCCERCGCKETDAIDFYTARENTLTDEVEAERRSALHSPLGIAFVTFASIESAERIVEDYACTARVFLHTPKSKYSKDLQSQQWIVRYAPRSDEINWQNLTLDYKMWYIKFILINLTLAVIVIIFTTPVFLFALLSSPAQGEGVSSRSANSTSEPTTKTEYLPVLAGVIVDTLPTMLIWVIGISLISLVSESDIMVGFWTKTAGNVSEMIKVFLFLTFMVVILPSLGVTSLSFILHSNKVLRWSCIFYKENGALFVNYVCTSCLVGTAAELMRLPELFVYAVKLFIARSPAEIGSIRKSVLWEFPMGSQYAWMMLHFAIMTCFSVIYPLVTPFGLTYLILKHWVDRYNIYFAYAPCKVEKTVHGTAVNFVVMCMFMLQINLLAFVHWHVGLNDQKQDSPPNPEIQALQVFSLIGFSLTAALFLGQICFNVCADFSPIQHFKSIAGIDDFSELQNRIVENEKEIDVEEELGEAVQMSHHTEMENRHEVTFAEEIQEGITPDVARSRRDVFHAKYIPPLLRPELMRLAHKRYKEEQERARLEQAARLAQEQLDQNIDNALNR